MTIPPYEGGIVLFLLEKATRDRRLNFDDLM